MSPVRIALVSSFLLGPIFSLFSKLDHMHDSVHIHWSHRWRMLKVYLEKQREKQYISDSSSSVNIPMSGDMF